MLCISLGKLHKEIVMSYPYTQQWKEEVSKSSDDWRHYCECFNVAKRFLVALKTRGQKSADAFLLSYLAGVKKQRGEIAEIRLQRDVRCVFKNEKPALDNAAFQSIHLADAA